ncbi:Asp23/Gls24 family envelope stress response protein [Enterococcus hermanniensis]|uniref:Stress response regulator gls24 homolog n=1 Tax=Enterococcus hermanniensis TaxID=249189 RepID=A0A1L8TPK1_9ENTE|nr:Asp23/Gls24 family envelope stress response protein [Enterococcus hermanniensis]OJG46249.1 hypothetical protein RV04_GL001415 [Enterococcus hermanniensis]
MSKHDDKNTKTPISAHPDPITPNESHGAKELKNESAPVSAHPDPVVPDVEKKVAAAHPNNQSNHSDKNDRPSGDSKGNLSSNHAVESTHDAKHDSANEKNDGSLKFEDKAIQQIIAQAINDIDGLLAVDGGVFSNTAEKLVNVENERAGIKTEVGEKQVAVDLKIVAEYGKDIEDVYNKIKELIQKEVHRATHLDVIEVNVDVTDVKTAEQFEKDSETVQDKVTDTAQKAGAAVSERSEKVKDSVNQAMDQGKEDSNVE